MDGVERSLATTTTKESSFRVVVVGLAELAAFATLWYM